MGLRSWLRKMRYEYRNRTCEACFLVGFDSATKLWASMAEPDAGLDEARKISVKYRQKMIARFDKGENDDQVDSGMEKMVQG